MVREAHLTNRIDALQGMIEDALRENEERAEEPATDDGGGVSSAASPTTRRPA